MRKKKKVKREIDIPNHPPNYATKPRAKRIKLKKFNLDLLPDFTSVHKVFLNGVVHNSSTVFTNSMSTTSMLVTKSVSVIVMSKMLA